MIEDVNDDGRDGDDDVMCMQNDGNKFCSSEGDLFLCQTYINLHGGFVTDKKKAGTNMLGF